MTFREGDLVGVPCTVQRGPFPDESLITVEGIASVRLSGLERMAPA